MLNDADFYCKWSWSSETWFPLHLFSGRYVLPVKNPFFSKKMFIWKRLQITWNAFSTLFGRFLTPGGFVYDHWHYYHAWKTSKVCVERIPHPVVFSIFSRAFFGRTSLSPTFQIAWQFLVILARIASAGRCIAL